MLGLLAQASFGNDNLILPYATALSISYFVVASRRV
jgi:hypothetical protein